MGEFGSGLNAVIAGKDDSIDICSRVGRWSEIEIISPVDELDPAVQLIVEDPRINRLIVGHELAWDPEGLEELLFDISQILCDAPERDLRVIINSGQLYGGAAPRLSELVGSFPELRGRIEFLQAYNALELRDSLLRTTSDVLKNGNGFHTVL